VKRRVSWRQAKAQIGAVAPKERKIPGLPNLQAQSGRVMNELPHVWQEIKTNHQTSVTEALYNSNCLYFIYAERADISPKQEFNDNITHFLSAIDLNSLYFFIIIILVDYLSAPSALSASDVGRHIKVELKRIWKEAVVA
jgi:hypothetical protein